MKDHEISRLPSANVPASDDEPKGTRIAEELNRIADRAESTMREQERRGKKRSAAQNAEAIERQRLVTEIRMMRRYRVNVAVDGFVGGVLFTGAAVGLYHLGRWILGELRRTQTSSTASVAQLPSKSAPSDPSAGGAP